MFMVKFLQIAIKSSTNMGFEHCSPNFQTPMLLPSWPRPRSSAALGPAAGTADCAPAEAGHERSNIRCVFLEGMGLT